MASFRHLLQYLWPHLVRTGSLKGSWQIKQWYSSNTVDTKSYSYPDGNPTCCWTSAILSRTCHKRSRNIRYGRRASQTAPPVADQMAIRKAQNGSVISRGISQNILKCTFNCILGFNSNLLVFSFTPFRIDRNKNQNCLIDKVQNLRKERRWICED